MAAAERKTGSVREITAMMQQAIHLPALRKRLYGTQQPPRMESANIEARPSIAEIALAEKFVERTKKGKRFLKLTSVRNIST